MPNSSGFLYLFKNQYMKSVYLQIAESDTRRAGLVLATVTGSRGSTPQKPGSSALFANGKLIAGTVGGGVIENCTAIFAASCFEAKESALLHFPVGMETPCLETNESALLRFSVGMETPNHEEAACGGTVTILADSDPLSCITVFREMQQSIRARVPGVLITRVVPWNDAQVMIKRCWSTGSGELKIPGDAGVKIVTEVKKILASGNRARYSEMDIIIPGEQQGAKIFLEPVFPLPKLVIAGAGHIGKAVSHQGKLLGFEVTVIDDREELANSDNLPDADVIIVNDISGVLREMYIDKDTFIVIVTHSHAQDADVLKECIGTEAAYVGMVGSTVKVAKIHSEFIDKKWTTEEQWQKICTPIGLEIGSKTIEEIAVSIAAQLVQARHSAIIK